MGAGGCVMQFSDGSGLSGKRYSYRNLYGGEWERDRACVFLFCSALARRWNGVRLVVCYPVLIGFA